MPRRVKGPFGWMVTHALPVLVSIFDDRGNSSVLTKVSPSERPASPNAWD